MTTKKSSDFAADADVKTFRYRGPNRRTHSGDDDFSREVRFDAKGNPVLDIRTNVPRRRSDDDTVDLLKCLDNSALSLEDDD